MAALLSICCPYYAVTQPQVQLKGTVYDISQRIPLEGVSVLSASGRGTATDSNGHYTLLLP